MHEILYLSGKDIENLDLPLEEVIKEIEFGLKCHGERKFVMPPKAYLNLEEKYSGHFNILRAYVDTVDIAAVKIIGDYINNFKNNLPSCLGLILLYDPKNGLPLAIMDGTRLTWIRTGAVSAVGAKFLARQDSKVLAHVGARGTAGMNIRAICSLFDIEEVRVTSKRRESREMLARELKQNYGIPIVTRDNIQETVSGADIIVEATRLSKPEVLIKKEWMKQGVLIIPYGWFMAVDPGLPFAMDYIVVDDWIQCKQGGQLYPLIKDGRLRDEHIYAEIGEICAGSKPGRTEDSAKILFWHRGYAISDLMIGYLVYERAKSAGIGVKLPYLTT
jgi:ornithine cyclodeaminase